jgi:hypothetical protein
MRNIYLFHSSKQFGISFAGYRFGFMIGDFGHRLYYFLGKRAFFKNLKTQRFSLWISNAFSEKMSNFKNTCFLFFKE